MTPTAIVRQQAEARAKRDILDQLRKPTLEMIEAGHKAYPQDMFRERYGILTGQSIRHIFVAMIEEFEK